MFCDDLVATDYMVTNGVIGGMGVFSPLSAIAPKLVREVYELCVKQQFTQARAAQENIATVHDLHATMLHLLGIDHNAFTYKFQGLDAKLTGVEGASVLKGILA